MFQYVRTIDIIKRMLDVFSLDYSFEIIAFHRDGDSVIVQGSLSHFDGERWYTKQQFGSALIKYRKGTRDPVSLGDDYKAAASDAYKKCATLMGVALDLYEPQPLVILSDEQKAKIISLLQARGTAITDDLRDKLSILPSDEAEKLIQALRSDGKAA